MGDVNRRRWTVVRLLFTLGAVLLVASAVLLVTREYLSWRGTRVDGRVVGFEREHRRGRFVYKPVVEFDSGSGRQRVTGTVASFPAAHELGARVPVYFDPADPSEAVIDSLDERYFMPGFLAAFGALATLAASHERRKRRPKRG